MAHGMLEFLRRDEQRCYKGGIASLSLGLAEILKVKVIFQ